jgi:hypothetical protein
MCFVLIWEQTVTCATYSINWLVFITEMKSVYSAVQTGSLNNAVCASSLKGYRKLEERRSLKWRFVAKKKISGWTELLLFQCCPPEYFVPRQKRGSVSLPPPPPYFQIWQTHKHTAFENMLSFVCRRVNKETGTALADSHTSSFVFSFIRESANPLQTV